MIPLGAAAVVVALALTLVILRNAEPQRPAPAQAGTVTAAVTGYRGTTPSRPTGRSAHRPEGIDRA